MQARDTPVRRKSARSPRESGGADSAPPPNVNPATAKLAKARRSSHSTGSSNRCHMTAAQGALATAMIYPIAPRGRRNEDTAKSRKRLGVLLRSPLRHARAVLAHSPPIASAVLAGSKSLDELHAAALSSFSSPRITIRLHMCSGVVLHLAEHLSTSVSRSLPFQWNGTRHFSSGPIYTSPFFMDVRDGRGFSLHGEAIDGAAAVGATAAD